MPITCYEITHDGEGEPGRSVRFHTVEVRRAIDARVYAERAAHKFDSMDVDDINDANDHLYGTSRVIEVRGLPGGPQRFRVRCEVVRRYTATKLEG